LLSSDYYLDAITPISTDYIGFWDVSGTAQGKCTIETLLALGGGGSMTWPASAGIAVYSGSSSWGTSITDNSTDWNTAYTCRLTGASGTAPLTLTLSSNALTGSISEATTSAAGSMSATDKTKLNGFRSLVPQSITTSASCATYCNFYTTASSAKTITFSNTFDGVSGQIEIAYSAAAVVTFAHASYIIKIASNIYNGTTGQVLSKSSGTAIYSYYVRNSIIYINGTQVYN
jgi:hypothetical protein